MGNAWLRTNTAGSGPYKVVDWKPSESVLMDLNPNYDGETPAMERVIVQHIQESATQRLQLERGDIDVARNLSPVDVAGLSDVESFKIVDELRGRLMYFSANRKNEMLSDPKVIEALKYAADYEGTSNSFLKIQYTVHQAFLPRTFLGALGEHRSPTTWTRQRRRWRTRAIPTAARSRSRSAMRRNAWTSPSRFITRGASLAVTSN
jgi:peptide/nickel transport system substrate-binding protein